MRRPVIIVDALEDWSAFASGPDVLVAADYLAGAATPEQPSRVISLCADTSYHSIGYYVSLLAEARGRRALPSVRTLLEVGGGEPVASLGLPRTGPLREQDIPEQLTICFGSCEDKRLAGLAAQIFNRYPAPLLTVRLRVEPRMLSVQEIRFLGLRDLDEVTETRFANALDAFSSRLWRAPRKNGRLDLAILLDPDEAMPPSNNVAIKRFERAARQVGFDPERIGPHDSPRLLEFDALFIRSTTAIGNVTYQMARRAAAEGMAVIDDPDSILRCCNKVFLHDLLRTHHIATPETRIIIQQPQPDYEAVASELGLPLVLKIPDGSFSRGVYKVKTVVEFQERAEDLMQSSAVIIAQGFVPTDFDWRIGVLDGRALYACRYHMARGHWQIINHESRRGGRLGGHDCVPLRQVPSRVLRTAVKAARLIGDGLYGVDMKDVHGRALVIEVNDNPSLESDVEDVILGDELYRQIMLHLHNRVSARGR